jgi:hypothetical protein
MDEAPVCDKYRLKLQAPHHNLFLPAAGASCGGPKEILKLQSMLLILALGAAGYFGYHSWKKDKIIAELRARPVVTQESLPEKPRPLPSVTVTCGKCGGLGKLIDDAGVREMSYVCPICLGEGKRQLPPGVAVCPRCAGIGRIQMMPKNSESPSLARHRIIAQLCPLCGGDGTFPDR